MTQQQLDILTGSFIPQLQSEYQKIADFIRGEGGFVPTYQEAFEQLQNLGEDYLERLNAAYAAYKEKADQVQQETKDLVKDNTELFNSYQQQLAAVQAVIDELEKLVLAYDEAAESARKAAIEAKEYWTAAQNQNANTDTSIKNEAPKPTGTLHDEEEIGNDPPKTPTLSQGMSIKIKSSATKFSRDGGNGTTMAK
jgi:methyl-accepting chemotaxis protein